MNWPRVSVRPATVGDLDQLHRELYDQRDKYEQQDLTKSIVFVSEYDGELAGFTGARLVWQVEPLLLTRKFKENAPHFAQQKATYMLIREVDGWIGDRSRNTTGLHSYFCSIVGRRMRKLAVSFGMLPVYIKSKFFGRDT